MAADVSTAGLGLVAAAPGGPVQAVGERVVVVVVEIEKSAYFGEGEWDQASAVGDWLVGFG